MWTDIGGVTFLDKGLNVVCAIWTHTRNRIGTSSDVHAKSQVRKHAGGRGIAQGAFFKVEIEVLPGVQHTTGWDSLGAEAAAW